MMELGDDNNLQENLEESISLGYVTEGLGRNIIYQVERVIRYRGLRNVFDNFYVDYIIRPGLEDIALSKYNRYNSSLGTAGTFFNVMLGYRAVEDVKRKVNKAKKGIYEDLIHIDSMQDWELDKLYSIEDEPYDHIVKSTIIITTKKKLL